MTTQQKNAEEFYPVLVTKKIRRQYSLNAELALSRQRDDKPEEWSAYNSYCELCKAEAKEELGLLQVEEANE